MTRDYRFDCTCGACPEQYDVYRERDNKYVGYIRCRWGYIVAHPVIEGQIVWDIDIYEEYLDDGWRGTIPDTDKVFNAVAEALDKLYGQLETD